MGKRRLFILSANCLICCSWILRLTFTLRKWALVKAGQNHHWDKTGYNNSKLFSFYDISCRDCWLFSMYESKGLRCPPKWCNLERGIDKYTLCFVVFSLIQYLFLLGGMLRWKTTVKKLTLTCLLTQSRLKYRVVGFQPRLWVSYKDSSLPSTDN